MSSVLWSKAPDDDRDESERDDSGDVDDSFAVRRLRRWIEGMFGGQPKRNGPEEGPRGNREVPPQEDA